MRSETGEAALNLAALGWQVLPLHHCVGGLCSCGRKSCRSQGKHPRTQHGLLDASADLWVVGHWWRRWPHANLAVATGPASGLWVLGPDGEAGVRAALALWPRGEESPHPVVANTGGGGRHYLSLIHI